MPSVPSKEVGRGPGTKRPRGSSTAVPAEGQVVNKSQFIDELAARYDGNRKAAAHALDSVLDTITRQVAKGEKVAITGFGSFEKAVRNARWVRNPQTGARVKTKKKSVPKFSAGADLKNVVSGAKKLPCHQEGSGSGEEGRRSGQGRGEEGDRHGQEGRVDGEEVHSQEGSGRRRRLRRRLRPRRLRPRRRLRRRLRPRRHRRRRRRRRRRPPRRHRPRRRPRRRHRPRRRPPRRHLPRRRQRRRLQPRSSRSRPTRDGPSSSRGRPVVVREGEGRGRPASPGPTPSATAACRLIRSSTSCRSPASIPVTGAAPPAACAAAESTPNRGAKASYEAA